MVRPYLFFALKKSAHNKRVCEIAAVVLSWSDKTTLINSGEMERQNNNYRYFANTPDVGGIHYYQSLCSTKVSLQRIYYRYSDFFY